jgi:hypothetical protein
LVVCTCVKLADVRGDGMEVDRTSWAEEGNAGHAWVTADRQYGRGLHTTNVTWRASKRRQSERKKAAARVGGSSTRT